MASPTDKSGIDLKKLLHSVIQSEDILPCYKSDLGQIVDKQPSQYVFPNHAVIPRKTIVFNDCECQITSLELRFDFDEDAYQKWLAGVLKDIGAYSTKVEMDYAIHEYAEDHQITEFAARILFKLWMIRLTAWGVITRSAGESMAAARDYYWRQPEAWVWFWQDGYSPSDAIIEDIRAGY